MRCKSGERCYKMKVQIELFTHYCCACGVVFAIPEKLDDFRRIDGKKIRCPNGHKQFYQGRDKKSEDLQVRCDKYAEDNQRLKDELAKAKQALEHAEARQAQPKRGRPRKVPTAK